MNETELMRTLAGDAALAQTLVERPGETIDPFQKASTGGRHALEALRRAATGAELRISKLGTIGEGGMGVVHLATQATLGRHVAVKTLKDGGGDLDATVRILREAWVTGALEHPNVVPVYDVGVDEGGAPFIVMKRVEGKAWADVMQHPAELERLLGLKDALEANLRVFISVCNAVHFAHARGILHRDVKPENVMIGEFGEVYLLDWGIAVSVAPDPSGRLPELSQSRGVAGTPSYMAPEMLLGDPKTISTRTDVYLLGATLYEIFAGAPPHVAESSAAMASSILLSQPAFATGFPAEAKELCARALARDPADRFESAEALKMAVEDYLAHRGSRKLARDAKRSLDELLRTIAEDPPSEERTLAIFNLLGECRFGYRAALAAWSGNAAARRGLDRALVAVVELEVKEGDAKTAAALLREVADPPAESVARVDAAIRARADEDHRLKQLELDFDPAIGTRTRTLIGTIFGVAWTSLPLVAWCAAGAGHPASHWALVGGSAWSLILGLGLYRWAKETLSKTLLNRRLAQTMALQMVLQLVLALGAYWMGLTPEQSGALHIFAWASVQTALALWVQPWFGLAAAVCAAAFLVTSREPSLLYPAMSICNAVFMIVLVRVWLPKTDIQRFADHERRLVGRARRFFHPSKAAGAGDDAA